MNKSRVGASARIIVPWAPLALVNVVKDIFCPRAGSKPLNWLKPKLAQLVRSRATFYSKSSQIVSHVVVGHFVCLYF